MIEIQVGKGLLGCALKVHRALGPGLLENVHEECLAYELDRAGISYARQVGMPVHYEDVKPELGYRLDLIVERGVVVEIKAVEHLAAVHRAQLLTYLSLSGIARVVNGL